MRKAADAARRLHAHLTVGMVRQRGEPLPQRGLAEPARKFGETGKRRIVGAAQPLLEVVDDDRAGALQHRGVVRLDGGSEPWQPFPARRA